MNWRDAVEAMRAGKLVRRVSESIVKPTGYANDIPVVDTGVEPMMLAAAWTDDDRPVKVFMGAWSRVPFVPDATDMEATDWVAVDQ